MPKSLTTKHPTPWRAVNDETSEDGPIIVDSEDYAFAQVYGHDIDTMNIARLYAKAPDLLDQVVSCLRLSEQMTNAKDDDEKRHIIDAMLGVKKLMRETVVAIRGHV